jgi:NADH-quinone oxidoreductase subunit E
MNLKPETSKIDEVITHYPVKRSAALPLLHLVQEDAGLHSRGHRVDRAKLELQPINVYELVTFYPMFRQKPIGRRHIKVCRTLSCALMGGYKDLRGVSRRSSAPHRGEVSPDGEVTIEFVECLASCGTGAGRHDRRRPHTRRSTDQSRGRAREPRRFPAGGDRNQGRRPAVFTPWSTLSALPPACANFAARSTKNAFPCPLPPNAA